jgi:peroxiredoxin
VDPATNTRYVLLRQDVYAMLTDKAYDDSPWTDEEMELEISKTLRRSIRTMQRIMPSILAGMLFLPLLTARGNPGEQSKQDKSSTLPKQLESLKKEVKKSREDVESAYSNAKTDQERQGLRDKETKQIHACARRALELAQNNPADPVAVDALLWIISGGLGYHGAGAEIEAAVDLLQKDYITSDKLRPVCEWAVVYWNLSTKHEKLLRTAMLKNPNRGVQAQASYTLAFILRRQAILVNELRKPGKGIQLEENLNVDVAKQLKASNPDDLIKEAELLFEQVVAKYSEEQLISEQAKAGLFELRNLVVGKTALDIEGQDIDGKPFKLSDYRGKVVLLTFSGNWCGPCRAMYPQERELVERLKDELFVAVSVNTDSEKTTLKESIRKGEITWRCWCDGRDGPITKSWAVQFYPTVYILDAHGVIRYKNVRDKEIDEAVDTLLKEQTSGTPKKQS